jgi:hypothetical protein
MSERAIYYSLRNSELVRIKNVPLMVLLRCFPFYIIGILAEFSYFAFRHRKFSLYLKAKTDAIRLLPKMLQKRKVIMKNKRVNNAQIYHSMTPFWQREFFIGKMRKFFCCRERP